MKHLNKILIGSHALKHHFEDYPREPKDKDFAVNQEGVKSSPEVEYLYNPVLHKWYADTEVFEKVDQIIIDPNELYTLKMSHLMWDLNWDKHAYDVMWLKDKWCKVIPELFYALYDFFKVLHGGNKRSDLEMTSEEFFDNAIVCDYEHDDLHTLLKETPTYTKVLKQGAEVEVSEDKFNELTFEEKCDLVREEVHVMAWERMAGKLKWHHAYSIMFKKFIISHAPMWEALFILDNLAVLSKPTFNYFEQIENNLYKLTKKEEKY